MTSNRRLFLALKSGPCKDCGQKFDPVCMQFDHVPSRGTKLGSVGLFVTKSENELLAEIAKCDIVCANCHALRTKHRGKQPSELVNQKLTWKDPEYRLRHSEAVRKAMARPEVKDRLRQSPVRRAQVGNQFRGSKHSDATRSRMKAAKAKTRLRKLIATFRRSVWCKMLLDG
jgi:hypothetical protein